MVPAWPGVTRLSSPSAFFISDAVERRFFPKTFRRQFFCDYFQPGCRKILDIRDW